MDEFCKFGQLSKKEIMDKLHGKKENDCRVHNQLINSKGKLKNTKMKSRKNTRKMIAWLFAI